MDLELNCECGCPVTVRNRQLRWIRCPDCASRITIPRNIGTYEPESWDDWDDPTNDEFVRKRRSSNLPLILALLGGGGAVALLILVFVFAGNIPKLLEFDREEIHSEETVVAPKAARVFANSVDAQNAFPPRVNAAAYAEFRRGNFLKDTRRFAEAELAYQQALNLEPNFPFAAYQLACNYCRWGKPDDGWEWFQRAVQLGLWSHTLVSDDSEIDPIRDRRGFAKLFNQVRERYELRANEVSIPPIVMRPAGDPPPGGWPIMVLMHGYGGTNVDFADHVERWAKHGFVAVAVAGPVVMGDRWFRWPIDSLAKTHAHLEGVLRDPEILQGTRRDAVFLLGFSQGALHALQLTADHPDSYAGVVAVSPGGLPDKLHSMSLDKDKPRKVWFVHGGQEIALLGVRRIVENKCDQAGWDFRATVHPGRHHFPQEWPNLEPQVAEFLLANLNQP